jgi:hypothetical protein
MRRKNACNCHLHSNSRIKGNPDFISLKLIAVDNAVKTNILEFSDYIFYDIQLQA